MAIAPPTLKAGQWVPSTFGKAMTGTGRALERGAQGAIGGAVGSPEDPQTGALGGAVMGQIPGSLAQLARSPTAQFYGAHMLPYAAAHHVQLLAHGLGIPLIFAAGLYPMLKYYHSPVGGPIRVVGQNLIDATGRVFATIPASAMGYFTGAKAGPIAERIGERVMQQPEETQ